MEDDLLVNVSVTKNKTPKKPRPAIAKSIQGQMPMFLFVEHDKQYKVFGPFKISEFNPKGPSVTLTKMNNTM